MSNLSDHDRTETGEPAPYDVVVIGAGPAGAEAALTASRHGLSVCLLDEAPAAGGQVWRAPPATFAARPGGDPGADLRKRLRESGVETRFARRVWNLRAGFEAHAVFDDAEEVHRGRTMVLAPGAFERFVPFSGWTLPGVIGLGAATVLIKSQGMLPGRRTVVAGAGPLLVAVAAGIVRGGGEIAAVVDLNRPADWMRSLPATLARPGLLGQGIGWLAELVRHGVPYHSGHAIVAANGEDAVAGVEIAPVDADWRVVPGGRRTAIDCDAVAAGHGLTPSTEMTRLLDAAHHFDEAFGEWVPSVDADGQTSIGGLYVAGDATGISGAAAAVGAGRLAGLAAALRLGAIDAREHAGLRRKTARGTAASRRFGRAMSRLARPRPGLIASVAPETIVCRCEDVTRAEIDAGAAEGARAIGQLKAWTRCGMGPCQGRVCGESVAMLMQLNAVPREAFGQMVARPPLRPVPIDALTGRFDYDEIALPPSLPTS